MASKRSEELPSSAPERVEESASPQPSSSTVPVESTNSVQEAPVALASSNGGAPPAPWEVGAEDGASEGEETPETGEPKQELTEEEKYVREVRRKWKTMTDAELRETMANPRGATELVREAGRMHEEQLQIIAPFMTDAQIASTIPSLQLQLQGALVQGFNASQIRHAVRAIPPGDRQLLLQNITLITSSETDPSKDDEIQGIIGFIDPLAMAVAVERPELVDKVIRATCIMTPEQIRVMVPLLTLAQVRTMIETIVSAEGHAMVMMMLMPEQREELVALCRSELGALEDGVRKWSADVGSLADSRLPELSRQVHAFCSKPLTSLAAREHHMLATRLASAKTQLERCHREVRNLQRHMKLPTVVLNEVAESEAPIRKAFMDLQAEMTKLGKTVTQQYAILDNSGESTGLIHKLYDTWTKFLAEKGDIIEETTESTNVSQEEQVYVDSDLSTTLYTAVQAIGNPNAIGDIFSFTWNDIIDQGFRTADDFTSKGITSLKQLETYIMTHKQARNPAAQPPPQPAE